VKRRFGRRRGFIPFALLSCFLVVLLSGAHARATTKRVVFTIAIGHNAVADVLKRDGAGLSTLRYADDDALRFHALMQRASRRAILLTVADADTQRRFPELARLARPPSLAELDRTVELVVADMNRARAAGEEPELVFFFSGHGVRDANGAAALSLLDGALTRAWLYEKLLQRVPARFVHLIVDACHAEALVRPRDVDAQVEPLDAAARARYLDDATLERFPHVGAVLASSSSAQSFEWDAYRSGVFAHQLLSALRGAADVNVDGRIEYSEVAAFLSAANLRVKDPRARLDIVVQAPRVDQRAQLLELRALTGQFELRGRADGEWAKGFFVESERGERVLDVYPEHSVRLALRLPVGERLYLMRSDGEVELGARWDTAVELGSLRAGPPASRARGSIDSAFHDGLFKVRFGPAFYQGYVSQFDDIVSVPFGPEEAEASKSRTDAGGETSSARTTVGTVLLAAAGASALAAGTFGVLALGAKNDYEETDLERPAEEARERFERYRTAAWVSAGAAVAFGTTGLVLIALPTANQKPRSTRLDGVRVTAGFAF
jgi:hypothetical protein